MNPPKTLIIATSYHTLRLKSKLREHANAINEHSIEYAKSIHGAKQIIVNPTIMIDKMIITSIIIIKKDNVETL